MLKNEFLNHYKKMNKSDLTILNYGQDLKKFYELMDLDDEKVLNLRVEDALRYIKLIHWLFKLFWYRKIGKEGRVLTEENARYILSEMLCLKNWF
jgi:hypothetical protein